MRDKFHHILRDTRTRMVLLGLPILQLLILSVAITNKNRDSNIALLDNPKDKVTQKIIVLDFEKLSKETIQMDEGSGHKGNGYVIRYVGIKK